MNEKRLVGIDLGIASAHTIVSHLCMSSVMNNTRFGIVEAGETSESSDETDKPAHR